MPYRLIKGKFHLFYESTRHVGSQPDGDSLWFKPNNPNLLQGLAGRSAEFNKGGFAQQRFEAIDALELHYKGAEQHHDLSIAARDFALDEAGFEEIEYAPELFIAVRTATPHPIEGYILTRNVDPYGRPVSFVFPGTINRSDGSDVWLDVNMENRSINAALARSGNAYPAFYTGLPTDLRNRIASLANQARKANRGLWKDDKSMKGFRAKGLTQLEKLAIWPKMFRRLVSYFKAGNAGLSGFEPWLRANSDDDLWIISIGEKGNLHDVFEVKGGKLNMLYQPGDLVIVPD
jgi:endonuclease YncB( thermonuclease family)